MNAFLRTCVCLAVSGMAAIAAAEPQYYVPQVQPKHSTMFGVGWEAITDNEFADMAQGLLVKNGASNARGATFLFEQCFSGGLFGELASGFGNDVRWVGGAAARHDESSWGQNDSASFAMDHWTRALQLAMQENDSMINTVNLARLLDSAGPNGSDAEHPQSIYRNGGETINHRTIGATFHNAVLWAGNANGERHVHDLQVMYNLIHQTFVDLGEPYTITVLGDSAQLGLTAEPATKANLQAAFNSVAFFQNPGADFLFFSTDHGGTDTYWQFDPTVLRALTTLHSRFTLSQAELEGMLRTRDGIPGMVMRFLGLDHPGLHVFLDDFDLGDPFGVRDREGMSMLDIDRELLARLGPELDVRIVNDSDFDVTLVDGLFRTGGIDNIQVPEPASAALLAAGLALLIVRRRRRARAG